MNEDVQRDKNHALGVLEHGMYSKRMCEHGRPLQIFKEEVSANKRKKKRGSGDVGRGVRWFIVPMKRVTIMEGRDQGNNNLDKETYYDSNRDQIRCGHQTEKDSLAIGKGLKEIICMPYASL